VDKGKLILQHCIDKAHSECVAYNDPTKAWDIVLLARQLELLGGPSASIFDAGGPIEKCLRFELEVDSTITDLSEAQALTMHVEGKTPLRMTTRDTTASFPDVIWTGTGSLAWTSIDAIDNSQVCKSSFQTTAGTFDVETGDKGAEIFRLLRGLSEVFDPRVGDVRMIYAPGPVTDTETITCNGLPATLPPIPKWTADFETLHETERFRDGFLANQWEMLGVGELYAMKRYTRSKVVPGYGSYSEDTTFTIHHKPE
ncbi:MAG TPA: hypothetical protein VFA98_10270, partial [Thermoanaerobaculia bacterium]|nr:hypothetical protein [Thermoanaerobaculia bacterium]